MANNSQKGLKNKLRALLSKDFETLSPDLIASVLSGLATEMIQLSEAGITQLSEVSSKDSQWSQVQDQGLRLECRSDDDVISLLHHILAVGAVVVPTHSPPDLNETVEFDIHFAPQNFTMRAIGRVVHLPPGGAAVELGEIDKGDRLALVKMQEEIARLESVEMERSESFVEEVLEKRASGSAPIPGIPVRTQPFRKSVDLTSPDVRILSAFDHSGAQSDELYGPDPLWLAPKEEADRIEPLADERILDILLQTSQDGFSGLLHYFTGKENGVQIQFFFDGGLVVDAACKPRIGNQELGWMLYRADRITKEQLGMVAAHADETNGTIPRSLLTLDILNPEQIRNSLAGRLTYLLRDFRKRRNGEIRIYDISKLEAGFLPAPPLRVHVPVEKTIYTFLFERFRSLGIKERDAAFAPAIEAYPEIDLREKDRLRHALQGDTKAIQFVNEFITGRKRLKEVITVSDLSPAESFGIIKALHRMGILSFDQSFHQTIVRERYRENVTVKFLSVHKASYFEVLNVHWSSYTDVVQGAYEDLIVQFDPSKVPEHLEPEVHQRVSEIRDRVESAFQILGDGETRRNYRSRVMPEYKLNHAIPLFLKQCDLAKKRRKWKDAKDALLRVLEIDPDHKDAIFELDRIEAILNNRLSPDAADSNF